MTTYVVTTSNWNDPSFWSAINESGSGHTLDFSALPSNFDVDFWPDSSRIIISDGTSTFTIGDPEFGGTSDANLGGSTQLDFFTTVIGSDGADMLDGGVNNDTVRGDDGNDTIEGNGGNDELQGDAGNDDLYGGAGNDSLYGGEGSDYLSGETGVNFLDGGAGGDTLDGNSGGYDIATYINSGAGVTIDLTDGVVESGGDAQGDTLSGIEQIDGSEFADAITVDNTGMEVRGWGGDDTLTGGAGADSLLGGVGADLLDGGQGDDTITGGDGADTISGGDAGSGLTVVNNGDNLVGTSDVDAFSWAGGSGNSATIRFNNSAGAGDGDGAADFVVVTTTDNAGVLTIGDFDVGTDKIYLQETWTGFSASSGSGFVDYTLTYANGNQQSFTIFHDDSTAVTMSDVFSTDPPPTVSGSGGNDVLSGGDDGDTFLVSDGFGNDTISGGSGGDDDDVIDLSGVSGPVTVSFSDEEDGTITDGSDTITFTDIERLILTDSNDSVDGSATNAGIFGDAPGINVEGRGGDDTIIGGRGGDTIDGGIGDDSIEGDYGDDSLAGGADDDTITGGEGNDTLDGGSGNDSLIAGLEADTVLGGAGDDVIDGGDGDDALEGGAGADTLTGGDGDDTFMYNLGDGADTITDFNFGNSGDLGDGDPSNNDFIDLSNFYDNISELRADSDDDGVLNQSNDGPGEADYSNNDQMASGEGLTFQGASRDSFTADNTGVVCFTTGTLIRTPRGQIAIDNLRVGDLVDTLDNGPQPIRWIATTHLDAQQLAANPNQRPVLFRSGVLGNTRDLLVSPQHGMLIGQDHLARATHLAKAMQGVRIANGKRHVVYVHVLFDAHQIIFAEGAPSESFYPGPTAISMMGTQARKQVQALLPALGSGSDKQAVLSAYGPLARNFIHKRDIAADVMNGTMGERALLEAVS